MACRTASVGAAPAALGILRSEPERMARARNGELLRRSPLRVPPRCTGGARSSPSRPACEDATAAAWRAAFDGGVYVNAVAYPAVPRGQGVLRLSVMATHTDEQLRAAAEIVAAAVLSATGEDSERAVA